MPTSIPRRLNVDVTWTSLFRIVAVLVLVWLWLALAQLVLLVLVAVILAIALDPVVEWLEAHGVSRGLAAALLGVLFVVGAAGFFVFAWASLASQGRVVGANLVDAAQALVARMPPAVQQAVGGAGGDVQASVLPSVERFLHALISALVVIALALILTLYLLVEGRQTYAWLVAFVPARRRAQVEQTVRESRRVIFAYAVGNIATSVFAAAVVLVALTLAKVPAAFLLALLAGVCDFVPVLGFIVSSVPAVVLALTVSPATALIVAAVYVAYHLSESYYVGPRVYGSQLRVSNVVVVLAFAAGGEIAGVVGALIALPVAAIYPAVERIWLRDRLGVDVVRHHREIAASGDARKP